jgi:3-phenylpropionate/trans-cinnamate dioxygenase ferredoxin component
MSEYIVGSVEELGPGSVKGAGPWVVVNVDGQRHALSRKCRHLRADLAGGTIDAEGCLVCPWHQARYDVNAGNMVTGPQGAFAKVPGLDPFFKAITKFGPLKRATVIERDGQVVVQA